MDHKTFLEKVGKVSELDAGSCNTLLESFAEILEETLANGDSLSIPSFGNFEPRKRKERIMSHPSSPGKKMLVPPKLVVSFKPSNILKNKINSGDNE